MTDDKIGLIVYAGEAYTQLPITSDYVSAKMFLETINPSMITTQGTDIKQAIDLAMKSFTPNQDVSKAIFVWHYRLLRKVTTTQNLFMTTLVLI